MLKFAPLLALLVLNKTVFGQDQTIDWFVPGNGQMDPITMYAGDTLTFNYTDGNHEVYIHPLGNCSEDGRVFVGGLSAGPAFYTFKDSEIGTNVTFACDYVNHCEYGQIISVEVLQPPPSASPSEVPTVSAAPSANTTSSPTTVPDVSPTPDASPTPDVSPTDAPATTTAPSGDRGTSSVGDAVAPLQTACVALFFAGVAMLM